MNTLEIITNTNTDLLANNTNTNDSTNDTTTTTNDTTTTTNDTTTNDTEENVTRYSMFEYYRIIENSFENFFNHTINQFDIVPKISKKKIAEFKEMAYSLYNKERYEEITVDDIENKAMLLADLKGVEVYELYEKGWAFVEEIAKYLCISPILLIESEMYQNWEYEYFY